MKRVFLMLLCVAVLSTAWAKEWVDLGLPSGTLWAAEPEVGFFNYPEAIELFGTNLPTRAQWNELLESCSHEDLGDYRIKMIGKSGNYIIIPRVGYKLSNGKTMSKSCGYYWTFNYYDDKDAFYVLMQTVNGYSMLIMPKKYYCSVWLINK